MDSNEIIKNSLKLINDKNFSKALDLLDQITLKDDKVFFLIGSIYIALNNLELAEENLKNSISLNSQNPSAYHNLANLYLKKKDLNLAKINYLYAIKINNNIPSLCELAFLSYKEGDFAESEKYYNKILEIEKENKQAKLGLGNLYLKVNKVQQGYNLINSVNGIVRFTDDGFKIIS